VHLTPVEIPITAIRGGRTAGRLRHGGRARRRDQRHRIVRRLIYDVDQRASSALICVPW
jgi:hypothetical protein